MMNVLRAARLLVAVLAFTVVALPGLAETFPNRTMRIVVPYPPGGSIDLTGRVIAKNLQDSAGQSVIVENKPGANAAIGIDDLMRSAPDGHTLGSRLIKSTIPGRLPGRRRLNSFGPACRIV